MCAKITFHICFFLMLAINSIPKGSCLQTMRKIYARTAFSLRNAHTLQSSVTSINYDNFSFQIHKSDEKTKARTGTIVTPHGNVETPNFVFCATKAAMKAVTPEHMRDGGSQIILSNTYHLMLTPGSELVHKMGGLQKFTNWRGPMLTDSGGYQIFSMGHGSVSSEIKGKRDTVAMGWNQTLINIDEQGATFRSYVDGTIFHLTPERSMQIQRELGADLIVVFDECTPFNVDKAYTAESMRRSHRWATRCLQEFDRTHNGQQALYGIIQGGIYEDLRDESTDFVNKNPFFGTAIGGSLGATKKGMHDIVAYTRARCRDDRPVHLLGIGGVRDIFHGVRQGIDTFDCVHPTRLGRHGGALVLAAHWDEESHTEDAVTPMTLAVKAKAEKDAMKQKMREQSRLQQMQKGAIGKYVDDNAAVKNAGGDAGASAASASGAEKVSPEKLAEFAQRDSNKKRDRRIEKFHNKKLKLMEATRTVREHTNVGKGRMRNDPRPIDATCGCYTCKNFSRAYLHHLYKAKESLGGTLVTIHNIYFMNRLMADIRKGIDTDTLDEVEAKYVHPVLKASIEGDENVLITDGIGS